MPFPLTKSRKQLMISNLVLVLLYLFISQMPLPLTTSHKLLVIRINHLKANSYFARARARARASARARARV